MILIDIAEWAINFFIVSMGLVALTMVVFVFTMIIYTIQDWRGK
jgi:hypothetical protein